MSSRTSLTRETREWLVAIALVAMVGFMLGALILVILTPEKGVTSSEAAGWMQAIGSVAAIFAAIWISSDQHRRQVFKEARDKLENERAFLENVHVEFEAAVHNVTGGIGRTLESLPDGEPLLAVFPVAERPFAIFDAHIAQLSLVGDAELRKKIVRTYLGGMALVQTFRTNNALVDEYEAFCYRAQRVASTSTTTCQDESLRNKLIDYTKDLRAEYTRVMQEFSSLLQDLEIQLNRT